MADSPTRNTRWPLYRGARATLAPRQSHVAALMRARRAVRDALAKDDADALRAARADVNNAKLALGERGPTWWTDGEDLNRHLARNTSYADWYAALEENTPPDD